MDAVEFNTWKFLTQRSPGGQAAAALYKLEGIAAEISHLGIESSKILLSVKDPAPGLDDFVAAAAERLGLGDATVELDDRNVDNAAVITRRSSRFPPRSRSSEASCRTGCCRRSAAATGSGSRSS